VGPRSGWWRPWRWCPGPRVRTAPQDASRRPFAGVAAHPGSLSEGFPRAALSLRVLVGASQRSAALGVRHHVGPGWLRLRRWRRSRTAVAGRPPPSSEGASLEEMRSSRTRCAEHKAHGSIGHRHGGNAGPVQRICTRRKTLRSSGCARRRCQGRFPVALERVSKESRTRATGADRGGGAEAERQRREGKPDRERPGCELGRPRAIEFFGGSRAVGEAGVNEERGVASVTSCCSDGCVQGKGFEGSCVPGKGSRAEAPRVAWLIPMSHSRSAAGVWKRDEPQDRLRDATSPQGDARSKPSKSGGTTGTEGAGGLADPCPATPEAARQSTDWLERAERAGLVKIRADAHG
jgi:hypothetical protein